ncbi:DNRLRE domain-containing protein [bacterium BMS3Abin03]|nr:DNRLRE domain-containing protein [bacterium BMS3Abin03]
MYTTRKSRIFFLFIVLLTGTLIVAGCKPISSLPTGPVNTSQSSQTVYLWISADKDTYVSKDEKERNFRQSSNLSVAGSQIALKRSYVHFTLPTLPVSTKIEEAYLELYHSGKNEDGKTDDIMMPVAKCPFQWNPLTLTYEKEPTPISTSEGSFRIKLRSQDWSGSENINVLMGDYFANPQDFFGFIIQWHYQSLGIEKGFYSNNHISRTVSDLGLAPRLLVKLTLPDGKTVNDITLPSVLPADNDLNFNSGATVLMINSVTGGNNWPASWDVAATK